MGRSAEMMDAETEVETIEALLASNDVYVTVSADTAKTKGVSMQRWHCRITHYNAFGALVQVYSPLQNRELLLSWAAILTVEPVPSYE
jgi:hypothetical protein